MSIDIVGRCPSDRRVGCILNEVVILRVHRAAIGDVRPGWCGVPGDDAVAVSLVFMG